MAMTDFVVRDAIVPALTATTKEAVIREIVESLRSTGHVPADVADDIVRAILKREQLGSTGIGRGIAMSVSGRHRLLLHFHQTTVQLILSGRPERFTRASPAACTCA